MRRRRAETPRYGSRNHYPGRAPLSSPSSPSLPEEAATCLDTVSPPHDACVESAESSFEDTDHTEIDRWPPRAIEIASSADPRTETSGRGGARWVDRAAPSSLLRSGPALVRSAGWTFDATCDETPRETKRTWGLRALRALCLAAVLGMALGTAFGAVLALLE